MTKYLLILFTVLLPFFINAQNVYYVSNGGNDADDGLALNTSWKTLSKVNSFSFSAGDQILFKRGDTFYGAIVVGSSGSSGSPITYGAYGTGLNPVISGMQSITSWTDKGSNIWESTNTVSSLSNLKQVVINGVTIPMGTTPNRDAIYPFLPNYYTYQSHTGTGLGTTSLTSSSLDGTNWTGADVVVRSNHWTMDKESITASSGTTITYSGQSDGTDGAGLVNGWGFFIQNDIRTLDQQGEWYYNPSTKKLSIYSTSSPVGVSVTNIDTVFYARNKDYITVDNLNFQGANTSAIVISSSHHCSVTNCNISYTGETALPANNTSNYLVADNNTFSDIGSAAIWNNDGGTDWIITNNNIKRQGLVSVTRPNDYTYGAINIYSPNALVQYNHIDSAAYEGIHFRPGGVQIKNNLVKNYGFLRDDGGGIYTGFGNELGKVIDGNIVLNSIGNGRGILGGATASNGIYADGLADGATIINNTVSGVRNAGIFLNNDTAMLVRNNLVVNSGAGTDFTKGNLMVQTYNGSPYAGYQRNNRVTNNIFYQKRSEQYNIFFYESTDGTNTAQNFGILDSNLYIKASDNNLVKYDKYNAASTDLTFSAWQTASSQEAHGTAYVGNGSIDTNQVILVYNPTKVDSVVSLGYKYIDAKNTQYNSGSITLAPYASALLIQNGALDVASADAGNDKTIYLSQTNTTTLDGSASVGSTFQWAEISTDYNSGATLTNSTSKVATVSGLHQGTFYFELTVNGSIKDTMVLRVDVQPAPTGGTLNRVFNMDSKAITDVINWRGDTTTYFLTNDAVHSQVQDGAQRWNLYRDRTNGIMIDSLRGKLRTRIEDGYGGSYRINGPGDSNYYARAELQIDNPDYFVDTNKIYMYEWKGYFPAETNYLPGPNNGITCIFQIHTNSVTGQNFTDFSLKGDNNIVFTIFPNGAKTRKINVGTFEDWTNKAHTIRLTVREGYGYTNNPSFFKLEVDGVQTILVDTGQVGGTEAGDFQDYAKFGTLYDAGNSMVDPTQASRNRKFDLITESFKQYVMSAVPPLTDAGENQIVTLPATSATLNGKATGVGTTISTITWTKISGGSATITNPNSLTTTITGLSEGIYTFNLHTVDANGLTNDQTTQVIVEPDKNIVATGYNYDVIVDGVLNGTVSSLRNHDLDGSGFSFYEQGFSTNSTPLPTVNGLPTDGKLISTTNTLYQLQPYNQNNALWLASGQSGTMTLSSPAQFDKIKIALTSGSATVAYQVNYSDGTHDNGSMVIRDWACNGCASYIVTDLGRINTDGQLETTYWGIYEDSIIPNSSKTVNSINFTPSGAWVAVFGLTDASTSVTVAPPTVTTSGNQTITVDNTTVFSTPVAASGENITDILWTDITGSGTATIVSSTSQNTNITNISVGTHIFRVFVTQSDNQTAYSDVTVTRTAPPTANAGTTQTITLPTSQVTLSGSATAASGHTVTYAWTKVSGPGTQSISNNTTLTPTISGMTIAGTYVFKLTVTQNDGQVAESTITIIVNDNIPPVPQAYDLWIRYNKTTLINK